MSACLMSFADPKLGSGPRWNLRGAVGGKKKVEVESCAAGACADRVRSDMMSDVCELLGDVHEVVEAERPGEGGIWEFFDENLKKGARRCGMIHDTSGEGKGTKRPYIEQLEAKIRMLQVRSNVRCTRMLQQALSGAEDSEVDFVFRWGQ